MAGPYIPHKKYVAYLRNYHADFYVLGVNLGVSWDAESNYGVSESM